MAHSIDSSNGSLNHYIPNRVITLQEDQVVAIRRASTKDSSRLPNLTNLNFRNTHLSKSHALLKYSGSHFYLKDDGSTFGTVVNDSFLIPNPDNWVKLANGDVVGFILTKPSSSIKKIVDSTSSKDLIDLSEFKSPQIGLQFDIRISDQTICFDPSVIDVDDEDDTKESVEIADNCTTKDFSKSPTTSQVNSSEASDDDDLDDDDDEHNRYVVCCPGSAGTIQSIFQRAPPQETYEGQKITTSKGCHGLMAERLKQLALLQSFNDPKPGIPAFKAKKVLPNTITESYELEKARSDELSPKNYESGAEAFDYYDGEEVYSGDEEPAKECSCAHRDFELEDENVSYGSDSEAEDDYDFKVVLSEGEAELEGKQSDKEDVSDDDSQDEEESEIIKSSQPEEAPEVQLDELTEAADESFDEGGSGVDSGDESLEEFTCYKRISEYVVIGNDLVGDNSSDDSDSDADSSSESSDSEVSSASSSDLESDSGNLSDSESISESINLFNFDPDSLPHVYSYRAPILSQSNNENNATGEVEVGVTSTVNASRKRAFDEVDQETEAENSSPKELPLPIDGPQTKKVKKSPTWWKTLLKETGKFLVYAGFTVGSLAIYGSKIEAERSRGSA